jgi:hypothetical protein
MDVVFIPIGNNGWIISATSPKYMPTFDLNRTVVQKAELRAWLCGPIVRLAPVH